MCKCYVYLVEWVCSELRVKQHILPWVAGVGEEPLG
jgi:hypothetical protein